jgi:hypothetical protein
MDTDPAAAPSAVVVAVAVVEAVSDAEPTEIAAPDCRRAVVFTLEIATLTAGAIPTLPLVAPARDCVVAVFVAVAEIARSSTFVSAALAPSSAVVVTVVRFNATEAPMPRLVPPTAPSFGCALALVVEVDAAASETSAPPASTAAPLAMVAVVLSVATTMASEPAIPTEPLAAPLVACADTLLLEAFCAVAVRPTDEALP